MLVFHRIVTWVLSPVGILILGCAVGLLVRNMFRRQRFLHSLGTFAICFSFASFWILGSDVTSKFIGHALERRYVKNGSCLGDVKELPEADAILVLGGGMCAHPACGSPEMTPAADRVWHGARLYCAEKAPTVILTGGDVERSSAPLLNDLGVPKDAIKFFPEAKNTEEEARIISDAGYKRILLVTSAWHMMRAEILFKRFGLDVIPSAADFEFTCMEESPLTVGMFFPTPGGIMRNSCAVKEWVALFGYSFLKKQ